MRDNLEEILIVLRHRPRALVIVIFGTVLGRLMNLWLSYMASLGTGQFKGMVAVVEQLSPWAGLAIFSFFVIAAIQQYLRDRDELWSRF